MVLERILYVDDDPNLRALFEVALGSDASMKLAICASGPEAVDTAPEFRPQLIVLDVNMPGMDGPATLAELRANGESSPAVFVTAETGLEELKRLKSLGVEEIVPKPFDALSLTQKLTRIWQQATA
ncbi:MAG: response regulator [Gammaproteobacteria bacterium]|nr:response regulator [Gammaproteobacteria bacterium]